MSWSGWTQHFPSCGIVHVLNFLGSIISPQLGPEIYVRSWKTAFLICFISLAVAWIYRDTKPYNISRCNIYNYVALLFCSLISLLTCVCVACAGLVSRDQNFTKWNPWEVMSSGEQHIPQPTTLGGQKCLMAPSTRALVVPWTFTRDGKRPISQIPERTCSISPNAPFRAEMCKFLFWMEHWGIWNRGILGFVNYVNYLPTQRF